GKTRLALEAAARMLPEFRGGVWLIELAAVSDPTLVDQTLADALGVREEGSCPLRESIRHYVGGRTGLLVVDNCEHLLDGCGPTVGALLRACPGLRVLATSRAPLGVPGEIAWRVPPLSLPYPDRLPSLEALAQCEAVRLFVERAARARPGFALD